MATHLRLESVVCRWKPLNAHNVVLRLVVMIIIRLLGVSDLRRTWSINSAELEFDISDMEKKRDGNDEGKHGSAVETGIFLLRCCTLFI
jgi:hypothetical protein